MLDGMEEVLYMQGEWCSGYELGQWTKIGVGDQAGWPGTWNTVVYRRGVEAESQWKRMARSAYIKSGLLS
jgi:hypothetical protein